MNGPHRLRGTASPDGRCRRPVDVLRGLVPIGDTVAAEFFVGDPARGRALVEEVARIVPVGPTRFLRRPAVVETETLDDDLHRITARCAVAVGRESLAEEFLPSLIKERAGGHLVVHGPIVTFVDDRAVRSFARATGKLKPARASHEAA